jgi:hypothetical protein
MIVESPFAYIIIIVASTENTRKLAICEASRKKKRKSKLIKSDESAETLHQWIYSKVNTLKLKVLTVYHFFLFFIFPKCY